MSETSGGKGVPEAERYRALLEINNAVVGNLTRETLFTAIAPALRRILPFERSAIFLHDPAGDVLRLYMLESSVPSDYFRVGLAVPAFESHMGRVFGERKPLLRRDLAAEREYPAEDRALADGIRAYVSVPLIARGKAIGTLAVASTEAGRYSEGDAVFLQEVAGQIALAVANMQAYEEIAGLQARLQRENLYLQEEIRSAHNFDEMVGASAALRVVLHRVEQVAPTEATVLVLGETGTGKELIARAIHSRSGRRDRALVKVDCTAIAAGLVESELFGHVKGAFTGAIERRIGRFELADHGHPLPRRGGRASPGGAGQAPPRAPGTGVRAGGEQSHRQGGRAGHRRDQPRPRGGGGGGALQGRPVLPAQRLPPRSAAPQGAPRGFAPARHVLPRALRQDARQAGPERVGADHGSALRLSLARQCPRGPERRGARRRPEPGARARVDGGSPALTRDARGRRDLGRSPGDRA
jgi:GAF domain-containing protein